MLSSLPPIVLVLRRKPNTAIRTTTARGGADRVERVGELRDGFLVAGGAVYVLGYLVWSVHAWQEGLGLLPALELQYLLAGSLLVLILLAALLTGMGMARLAPVSGRWNKSSRRSIRWLWVPVLGLAGVAIGVAVTILLSLADKGSLVPALFIASFLIAVAYFLLQRMGLIPSDPEDRPILVQIVVPVGVAATVFYITVAYPNVPQELGGVKPRCGRVEIARVDASGLLARELFPQTQTTTGIARSRKLLIFFSGGESYIVRAKDLESATTYELRKEIVKSVSDC